MNMIKQIQKEVQDFISEEIEIVPKYKFNQLKTTERNIRLYNSRFEKGEFDSDGFRKYYLNIVRNPCTVGEKAIAFKASDISVLSTPGGDYRKAWIADRDFRYWIKTNGFSQTLSRIFHELPIFGSVVLKKVKGKYRFVDLRNFIVEMQADSLDRAEYVIEQHFMTPDELRGSKWENIEQAIELWRGTKKPYIRILERRGELPESEIKEGGDPNKIVRAVYIAYVPETETKDRFGNPVNGITLWAREESIEDFPYREFHWEKIPGRWLGLGRVEINTDAQVRTNELINLRVRSSYFAALNLWQTRDTTLPKNLIKEVTNGDVLQVMSEITRVPTEERNMAAFSHEENRWMQNRDEQSMSFDVIRGERLPAGTPLGSAQLAAEMTTSYFDTIRRRIAVELKEFISKDVFKEFLANNSTDHYMKLVGEDLDQWHALMVREHTNVEVLNFISRNKKLPTGMQFDMMKASVSDRLRQDKEVSVKVREGFYKDFEYEIDLVITEEHRKMQARSANMSLILQAIQQDPDLLVDPGKRKIFRQLLESIGMSMSDVEPNEATHSPTVSEAAGQQVRGGGISAPQGQQVEAPEPQVV